MGQVDLSKHRGEVVTAMELDRLVPAHVPRSSCQILNSVEKIIGASPVAHVGEIPTDAASNRGEGSPGVSSGVVATQPQSETRSSKCKLFAWQDGDPRGKVSADVHHVMLFHTYLGVQLLMDVLTCGTNL